jgi:hypothetical protein
MKYFENEFVKIWIEDEILLSEYRENLVIDIAAAKSIVEARVLFTEGKSYPILIDFTNLKSANKEARDFMNDPSKGLKGLVCGAFVGNNAVATLFINLYLRIYNPPIPTKFFTDRSEALIWLKETSTKISSSKND